LETSLDDPLPFLLAVQNADGESSIIFFTINILILLLLLLFSGLVSGSEVAFFSLSSKKLFKLKDGTPTEHKIYELVSKPKRLLATILILNNLINVAIVTLSTFISWKIFGTKEAVGKVVAVVTFVTTFAIVFFGEVVPKIYANQKNISFAMFTLPMISFFDVMLKPFSWILMSMTNIIEKRIKSEGYQISIEDLNKALEITVPEDTPKEEKDILKGIVNFGQLTVKQVMKSRIDITAFDVEMDFHELMDKINKCGFSRIPVYKETIDNIQGILYNKDLLPHLDKEEDFKWQKLLRPGFFVPETKNIDTLLKDFQAKRVHMAIVADEYGGTSGIITMEDIIEEIVGEINDEFDDDEINFNKLNENTYVFEGKTTLHDFCKLTETDPLVFEDVKGESESIGGLLLELNEKLPRAGEQITFENFVFTVVSVDQRRIKRVRVLIKHKKQ